MNHGRFNPQEFMFVVQIAFLGTVLLYVGLVALRFRKKS